MVFTTSKTCIPKIGQNNPFIGFPWRMRMIWEVWSFKRPVQSKLYY